MKANSLILAQRYALAYDGLAKDGAQAAANYKDLQQAFAALEDVRQYLLSPVISREVKEDILKKILKDGKASAFIKILVSAKRFDLAGEVLKQLHALLDKRDGITRIKIRSFKPLSSVEEAAVQKALSSYFNAKAVLDIEKDDTLLAGMVIKQGDVLIDSSAKGRIKQLAKNLTER
jgi:F-type H+-transporting ATPase subunit delta